MRNLATLIVALLFAGTAAAATPGEVECIVPSKPGGAMDLTCKLVRDGLRQLPDQAQRPLRLRYQPGGIGAVAWHSLISSRRADPDTLVAFSGGSLLNLAQGKFGKATPKDVRWVAALGTDYGMIAVRPDSPYKTLPDLVDALRRDPGKVLIGVSGTIGSQDWLKMAMLVKAGGIDPKVLRFVALEGGGEAFTAMQANFVHVVSGDTSEAQLMAAQGKVRVLAVLAERRLPGALAAVPTAREQGYDVVWPTIRGVWMSPQSSEADYRRWVATFDRMMATPEFDRLRAAAGMYPLSLTGQALTDHVQQAVDDYRVRAAQFGLLR
ncbi:putative tricarboxylic transport membrane protein [Pseudoduganella flava]|uniref:Putative tricarboxylic transport membrane protein n=1 Tax=Pseudoduganella flava TaxID=871742 RepID=A0A562PSW9_9BURK|nr:tripartite tricarboxylate transporter substrate-binding protein [Pseudoduganella flava]QGZ39205.1 tripartite tricarboxylate transporter substrate binding protein [Pseudoduganella flava]TWI47499.1 putative tricarboxylic transport membrane protein [Pseudoduganella flava]